MMINNEIFVKKSQWHPFHIVDPSPWPLVVSLSAFTTTFGLVLWMHGYVQSFMFVFLSISILVLNMCLWFRDIVREGTFEGAHTLPVQTGLRFGMVLFIVSEIMLFFAFFWAFFHSSLSPAPEIGAIWPPKGITVMNPWGIPLLNTGLLLTSGAALTWSHSALLGSYKLETIVGLLYTIVLAIIFTVFQGYEYVHAPFDISDGIYGSTFYMLTGLHGFHVIVGTILLLVSLYRTVVNHFTTQIHIGYESAAWYWHFVDVVWIFLFIAVYIWGTSF